MKSSNENLKSIDAPKLASNSNILSVFDEVLHGCTFAGETSNAKLIYLTTLTRHLDKPVSLVIKGPSASGKSYLLDTALKFVPPSAYIQLSGMSEKALIYSKDNFSHRHIVVSEFAGLQNENGLPYLRTLLTEGQIDYLVTQKEDDDYVSKHVVKEGPTGLIMTTTENTLHPEDESRMLSLMVDDSRDQIRDVMRAQLKAATGQKILTPDFSDWHVLHDWVGDSDCQVVVPFGPALADLIPPTAHRINRDVGHMISLIKAHSLLHQMNRNKNESGDLESSIEDYRVVRNLIVVIVSDGAAASVSPHIRETVEVVQQLFSELSDDPLDKMADGSDGSQGISITAIGELLNVDKSSASRRVESAVEMGYLENHEPRPGYTSRIVPANAMPEDQQILPTAEEVEKRMAEIASEQYAA
jgi:hypothetical protein